MPALSLNVLSSSSTSPCRNTSRPIALIGFQQQGNLGLGYLASVLRQHGYRVFLFDFEEKPETILESVTARQPLIIGYSLIFQFYIHRFADLMRYLREHGVSSHFTVGGHFPSLSYQRTLELMPNADSVVRFEGEATLLELADRLSLGLEWHNIEGIAYRQQDQLIATPLRPLISDLDQLPYPVREYEGIQVLGQTIMPILASRGCARTCSFCSIHMFYRTAPGKVVRTRKPAEVVREMRALHEEHGVKIFLFQDDDFPLFGPVWHRWTREFLSELQRSGLPGRAIWKINCRADAVDPELFLEMRDAGLYLVYMGLESGTEEGLKTLHKQITVEQNIAAVDALKKLGILFEFGFMLFDPSSTFESVRQNIAFLRRIVGDGSAAAGFCKMLPYDGTPIKDELQRTGRLIGDVCHPDYDFLDPQLNAFYTALLNVVDVTGWIHGYSALSPQINSAWHEVAVLEHLLPALGGMDEYRAKLQNLTQASNELLFRVVEDTLDAFTGLRTDLWSSALIRKHCAQFSEELLRERDAFILRHQAKLLQAIQQPPVLEPAFA
ncbi:MAG: B12-binding domain-containing radical SAM protein [Acidobacteriaceae bacterium]|nr:B12-binding domain-containing radical SAM protein [Acidobacteriaceae bacterium]MBV9034227.1 B12-binding domain-containing radical SAM protein [Acidobacteriaceae bacterium]MBV9679411.1 B12-binding domain-containing radical SAM protein [Acidobacteriaceae bacterium]MBV9940135.1 B12-binding domain-containing radical SAM protein [Acidobacteriaceae bacterium]